MADGDLDRIIRAMQTVSVQENETVIEEGANGDFFYVVQSGILEVIQRNTPGVVDILTRDRVFGELALIYDSPRVATVRAKEESTLWALSSAVFRNMATKFMEENLKRRVEKLRQIPAFANLTDEQLRRVSAVMQEERFAPGTEICYQGEVLVKGVNDKFYTIAEGYVVVNASGLPRKSSRNIMNVEVPQNSIALGGRRSTPPDMKSPASLKQYPPAPTTPTTTTTTTTTATTVLNNPSPTNGYVNGGTNVLMAQAPVSLSDTLNSPSGSTTSTASRLRNRCSSSDLVSAEDPSSVVSLGNLGPGEWFGEIALMSDAPRSANVIALGNMGVNDTVCYTLSRGAYDQIISPTPAQVAISGASEARKADNYERKMRHQRDGTAAALSFESLELGPVIGEGGFSVVRLVTDPITKEVFALKTMNKADLWKRKQVSHVNNERKILLEMNHPFILSLIKTFQDENKLFMVLEFMQGGELFTRVLKSGGGLPMRDVHFYSACVIEGLDYLHRKRIAYRDLKLENLVIGTDGYLKIIDFGFAKQIPEGMMTGTLCGTPDYLSPEAVMRTGHNHAVDCWGFGVLLYEMLTQYSPYADPSATANKVLVFQNIMRGVRHVDWNELARPFRTYLDKRSKTGVLDQATIRKVNEQFDNVQDLLYRVWDPNPISRASAKVIKAHPYFSTLDWATLREQAIQAPWIPSVDGVSDLRYFDVDTFKDVCESDLLFTGPQNVFEEFGKDFGKE